MFYLVGEDMLGDVLFATTYKQVLHRNICYISSFFNYGVDGILVFCFIRGRCFFFLKFVAICWKMHFL